jgi:hypothetical protein
MGKNTKGAPPSVLMVGLDVSFFNLTVLNHSLLRDKPFGSP